MWRTSQRPRLSEESEETLLTSNLKESVEGPNHQIRVLVLGFLLGFIISLALSLISLATRFQARSILPVIPSGTDNVTGKPLAWFGGPCGRTSTEASSLNCHFDALSFSWLPP